MVAQLTFMKMYDEQWNCMPNIENICKKWNCMPNNAKIYAKK